MFLPEESSIRNDRHVGRLLRPALVATLGEPRKSIICIKDQLAYRTSPGNQAREITKGSKNDSYEFIEYRSEFLEKWRKEREDSNLILT